MEITFLGTGAAEGIPAEFCKCEFCSAVRKLGISGEVRTRAQVLINSNALIDFPPDSFYHSFAFGFSLADIGHIFVTHSHMDHFYAHDFILHGYKYAGGGLGVMNIYGNSEVKGVFDECTAREMKPEVAEKLAFNIVSPYSCFNAGEYRVIVIPAEHTATEDSLLYYVEQENKGYLHLHDTGNVSDDAVAYLAKNGARASVVAYDCTFGAKSGNLTSRHMGLPDVLVIKEKLAAAGVIDNDTRHVLTHFSHNCRPWRRDMAELAEQYGLIAAYDGMKITI